MINQGFRGLRQIVGEEKIEAIDVRESSRLSRKMRTPSQFLI